MTCPQKTAERDAFPFTTALPVENSPPLPPTPQHREDLPQTTVPQASFDRDTATHAAQSCADIRMPTADQAPPFETTVIVSFCCCVISPSLGQVMLTFHSTRCVPTDSGRMNR